jgi:putative ABC transport system substrate-binding protein
MGLIAIVTAGVAGFVGVVGGLGIAFCAYAQAPSSPARIGFLSPADQSAGGIEPFRRELSRLGYIEGQNYVLEYRSARGRFDQLPALAMELVGLRVDVIVAVVTQATIAAKRVTDSIPIVMVGVSDPVGSGLVASLARPGGNVTGTSALTAEVVGKQVELLKETLPEATRVAALWNPGNTVFQRQQLAQAKSAAARSRLRLHAFEVRSIDALPQAFVAIADEGVHALLILSDPLFVDNATSIARLASAHRLPTFSGTRVFADAGVLVTYGPDYSDEQRRAAGYVDRILKGAKPGDLAVEQAAKFELVVNVRTARLIGVSLPRPLILRADQLIDGP